MSWSLSSLGTYEQCGLKYKYKYLDKLEDKRSTSATRGVDNHALIEHFLKGDLTSLPPPLDFYQSFLAGLKTSYEIYPEHKISLDKDWTPVPWKDAWYKGVLDLLVIQDATQAVVYDWKTGKVYPEHEQQKDIYSIAVFSEHSSLLSVRAVHVYLDSNRNIPKVFHRSEVQQLRLGWENRVKRMEQDPQLIPNPGWHCRYCSFSRQKGGPCAF